MVPIGTILKNRDRLGHTAGGAELLHQAGSPQADLVRPVSKQLWLQGVSDEELQGVQHGPDALRVLQGPGHEQD